MLCGVDDANLPYLKKLKYKLSSSLKHLRNTTTMFEAEA